MEVAVEPAQCAIVSAETLSDGSRRFELVTLRGEPGELIAWREGDAILARARLGRFGDPQAESELLAALARRLRQLHGVEWAPR